MMSSPHCANGHGVVIGMNSSSGECERLPKRWHLSHRRTIVMASLCMEGQ